MAVSILTDYETEPREKTNTKKSKITSLDSFGSLFEKIKEVSVNIFVLLLQQHVQE